MESKVIPGMHIIKYSCYVLITLPLDIEVQRRDLIFTHIRGVYCVYTTISWVDGLGEVVQLLLGGSPAIDMS